MYEQEQYNVYLTVSRGNEGETIGEKILKIAQFLLSHISVETNSNFWSNTNTNNYSDSILGRIRIRIIIRILKKYSNIFEYLKIFE